MYDKILVPLDGSRRAEAILPHVENLASCYGAEVILLHVLEPTPIIVGPYDAQALVFEPEQMESRRAEMDDYLAEIEGNLNKKEITSRRLVIPGPVVETIIETAVENEADLIAMASHGRSGLARVFYGSVAAGILQKVDRPLLLVRARDD